MGNFTYFYWIVNILLYSFFNFRLKHVFRKHFSDKATSQRFLSIQSPVEKENFGGLV